jgi:hypothetical protein
MTAFKSSSLVCSMLPATSHTTLVCAATVGQGALRLPLIGVVQAGPFLLSDPVNAMQRHRADPGLSGRLAVLRTCCRSDKCWDDHCDEKQSTIRHGPSPTWTPLMGTNDRSSQILIPSLQSRPARERIILPPTYCLYDDRSQRPRLGLWQKPGGVLIQL